MSHNVAGRQPIASATPVAGHMYTIIDRNKQEIWVLPRQTLYIITMETNLKLWVIRMRKTDCFGETSLVLNVPSSSWAGKRIYYHYSDYYGNKPEALSRMRHRWGTHQGSCPGPQQPPTAPQTSPSAHHHGTLPVCLHTCNRTSCQSLTCLCCECCGFCCCAIRNPAWENVCAVAWPERCPSWKENPSLHIDKDDNPTFVITTLADDLDWFSTFG